MRTRTDLKNAIAGAYADRGRFRVIEVMLEPGAISDTLSRFVEAFRGRQILSQDETSTQSR